MSESVRAKILKIKYVVHKGNVAGGIMEILGTFFLMHTCVPEVRAHLALHGCSRIG